MEESEFRIRVMSLQRLMYSVALKMGMTTSEAADVVQEALLRLWRNRNGIPEDDAKRRAYCITVLRNECVTAFRRQHLTDPLENVVSMRDQDQEDKVESRDTERHIERLIDSLPEGQRVVVRMSGFGRLSVAEISEATGHTPENVRQLLSRGRKRLRKLIDNGIR